MDRRLLFLAMALVLGLGGWALVGFLGHDGEGDLENSNGSAPATTGEQESKSRPRRDSGGDLGPGDATATPKAMSCGLRGRVLRALDQAPVPTARVVLRGPGGEALGSVTCDREGRFRIEAPAASPGLRLRAEAEGLVSAEIAGLELAENELRDLGDLELVTAMEIRGRLRDEKGRPVAGGRVRLMPNQDLDDLSPLRIKALVESFMAEDEALDETTSDAEGRFSFPLNAAGVYGLVAEATGRQTAFSNRIRLRAGQAAEEVELVLGPGIALRGLVRDEAGEAVAGALVAALAKGRDIPGQFRTQKARSDGEGRFVIEGCGEGRNMVMCRAEGFAPWGDSIRIADGKPVEIRLERGQALEGRVREQGSEKPLAEVHLAAFGKAPILTSTQTDADGHYRLEGLSSERAILVAWKEGLQVVPEPGLRIDNGPFSIIMLAPDEQGRLPERLDIHMRGGGRIEGRVVDASSGEGIAGARVFALGSGDSEMALISARSARISDGEGRFVLDGVAPGPFTLMAMAPDHRMVQAPSRKDLRGGSTSPTLIEAGQVIVDQVVPMTAGLRQVGRVVDGRGRGVAGAILRWGPQDATALRDDLSLMLADDLDCVSDGEGRFEIRGLDRDRAIEIEAEHPDFPGGGTYGLAPGTVGAAPIELVMKTGSCLEGLIRRADGSPLAGAEINLRREVSGRRSPLAETPKRVDLAAVSDATGAFRFEGLAAGRWGLMLDRLEGDVLPADFQDRLILDGEETRTLVLDLRRNLSIRGILVDAQGRPCPGCVLVCEILLPDGGVRAITSGRHLLGRSRSDKEGRFGFSGLDEGQRYRVTAYRPNTGPWGRVTIEGSEDQKPPVVVDDLRAGQEDLRIVLPGD
ncbi:MAG: carboxypeptidase regulatory-like domain-containing protein [Planctomycetes bacterium]|nr:carboxypeptidase regulatory-like domain-containing protein [Planctomycetota bacterium]